MRHSVMRTATVKAAAACSAARAAFVGTITTYLTLAASKGLLTGGQEVGFRLLAERVRCHVQSLSFRTVVAQDVAFFDGVRYADLLTRLERDTSYMLQPLEHTLASTLTNLATCAGGLALCFATSWRLSLLALTTLLPVATITQAYAHWSGHVHNEIRQAQGEAAHIAHEALSNLRTVRSVSSEADEVRKHRACLQTALAMGVRDGLYGALTSTLRSYLDLGTSGLLLWSGGLIAMSGGAAAHISVGSLITFTLYWNLMMGGLQPLGGVLLAWTKSAGAAERVLALLECTPDIPPDAGVTLAASGMRGWGVSLEAVSFRYQMRPDQAVLNEASFDVNEASVCALVGRTCPQSPGARLQSRARLESQARLLEEDQRGRLSP